MKKHLSRKIDHIRQQPDDVRVKKVGTYILLIGGGVFVLWLFLLLPIQLHVNSQSEEKQPGLISRLLEGDGALTDEENETQLADSSRSPQVGGATDQAYRRPLPSGPFFKTAPPGAAIQDQDQVSPSPVVTTPPATTSPSPSLPN